jgi:glyoxylase-like metal-dependent hydrolase (beta-lactamase superfamily II)
MVSLRVQSPKAVYTAEAGHARERVDTVLCTHLHVDHVGWNTMLAGGRWVPTFPNARYLFGRKEWEHWSKEPPGPDREVRNDSVRPVLDAGLADLVEMDHRITGEVRLEPTPGHTPGHVSVRIAARRTRRAFLERYADRPVLVLGTHFATPTGGRIVRDRAVWRFAV